MSDAAFCAFEATFDTRGYHFLTGKLREAFILVYAPLKRLLHIAAGVSLPVQQLCTKMALRYLFDAAVDPPTRRLSLPSVTFSTAATAHGHAASLELRMA